MAYQTHSGSQYEIELADPFGLKLDWLNDFVSLDYMRTVNQKTPLVMTLPYTSRVWRMLRRDCQISVLRQATPHSPMILETDTIWLVRTIERNIDQGTMTITAYCGLDILDRPIVAYATNSPQDRKHTYLESAMKQMITENMIIGRDQGGATSRRNISAYFEVEPDRQRGPVERVQCAHQRILPVLQAWSTLSMNDKEKGIVFDVIWANRKFLFQVYAQRRGIDRRFGIVPNGLAIGPDDASLIGTTLSLNWEGEATYVYAGGAGMYGDRLVAAVQDVGRANASPFMKICETWENAQSYGVDPSGVETAARIKIQETQPRLTLQGQLQETPDKRYGADWFWGDQMTAVITDDDGFSQLFDVTAHSMRVQVRQGQERISTVAKGTER